VLTLFKTDAADPLSLKITYATKESKGRGMGRVPIRPLLRTLGLDKTQVRDRVWEARDGGITVYLPPGVRGE
jgi:hypothetical protein